MKFWSGEILNCDRTRSIRFPCTRSGKYLKCPVLHQPLRDRPQKEGQIFHRSKEPLPSTTSHVSTISHSHRHSIMVAHCVRPHPEVTLPAISHSHRHSITGAHRVRLFPEEYRYDIMHKLHTILIEDAPTQAEI